MDKMPSIVQSKLVYVQCVHEPETLAHAWPTLRSVWENLPDKILVQLTWQLQLDGTYRKLGQCSKCGQIYVTEEIRETLGGDNHVR